jgi:electron transfer flavoprotein alpha subunit
MPVLVIIEHHHSRLTPAALSVITAALQLPPPVRALVAGINCEQVSAELQTIAGIEEILVADHECYQHHLPESWAELIAESAKATQSSHVLAPATTFGKNILPRAAALLNVGQISDITKIMNTNTYQRPV